jgi:hypothetical protein
MNRQSAMRCLRRGPFSTGNTLLFEGETKLFNDRVRQNFARDPFYFRLRLIPGYAAVESNFEILSLPYFLQALVSDLRKCAVDRLSLRIQNALLQRNVDVGFHQRLDYTSGGGGLDRGFRYGRYAVRPLTLVAAYPQPVQKTTVDGLTLRWPAPASGGDEGGWPPVVVA